LVPGGFLVTKTVIDELSRLVIHAFDVGFRLAAPAVILLICVDLTLGLIGKTASKMQIFFVGLPLKISMGLFSFGLILGFIMTVWSKDIARFPDYFIRFFQIMRI
jgi:flagellar biosynthetic protein FliR